MGTVVATKELGLVKQTLRNWVKASAAGKLTTPDTKPVTPEQMELYRLRAENAQLKMHGDNTHHFQRKPGCRFAARWLWKPRNKVINHKIFSKSLKYF